jgi:hypothetical protein
MRARFALAATIAAAAMLGGELIAQTTTTSQTPPMNSVLAGKKLTPPIRGEAALEWVDPKPERKGDMVITRMTVRNASAAPIARLQVDETWYDKAGNNVTAGRGVINGLLQSGETAVLEIQTPWKAGMSGFQRQYKHANGTIKPVKVNKLDAPKPTTDSATSSSTSTTSKPATTTTAKPATTTTAKPTTTAPADTTKKP